MPSADYINGVFRAYEGEVYGECLFRALAKHEATDDVGTVWSRIGDMERLTQERLLPLATSYDADLEELVRRGQIRASEDISPLTSLSWRGIVEHFLPKTPAALSRYKALKNLAPKAERVVIGQLLGHGQAFADCMHALHAGRVDAAAAVINTFLESTQST